MNGIVDADKRAGEIKAEIRRIKKEPASAKSKREIRQLYAQLDDIQFKPDYMCMVIDKVKDYHRACKGFKINGIKYVRLLGTNGGIKNSTIVFVSERLADELKRRIENGRDDTKKLVTAKLEAYRALTCSASNPVSMPHGILVVNDAETTFTSDIIYLTDENDGEPEMEYRTAQTLTMDMTDGFGIMLPSLAERWSGELGLDYVIGGANTRFAYEKGMIYTFDFLDFAENVAHDYIVKDAWGDDVDVRNVEAIFTTSMIKLWDSYGSCEEYIQKSESNGYTFGISKVCPKELENERSLNYQFIQSYMLSDDDIARLIDPTRNEIREVLGGDWRKAALFLRGIGMNEKNVRAMDDDFIKAVMIDSRLANDPFVQNSIYQLIKNRINEAKVGVIKVHGNYSMISGDPYLLCQSMFGLDKTGLLGAGEIYNEYWADCDAERLACFRAPMTCHNNIRLVSPVRRDDARYWYRYMHTATVMNSWDTATSAMNGADFDGDLAMLTDNSVLVERLTPLPALMCAQRNAQKRISTDEDFIQSNIDSFGNEIGQTTNWITSMFEVRESFPEQSEEYKTLSYRIMCGQLYQQNAIDKAKGIVCKPMPREWHDRHAANKIENEEKRSFYRSIVADRKPYFMRYIYPDLMKKYNTYIKNTERNALREFQMTVHEMMDMPYKDLTPRQQDFLKYYAHRMPVGTNDCVMNKICRIFEDEFDGFVGKAAKKSSFDYTIMTSDAEYTARQYSAVKKLYEDYNRRVVNYTIYAGYERVDKYDASAELSAMNEEFRRECAAACPNEDALCNILLDLCYTRSATKRFVWSICGHVIIRNLLANNGGMISFPEMDETGDITYCGHRFSIRQIKAEADE